MVNRQKRAAPRSIASAWRLELPRGMFVLLVMAPEARTGIRRATLRQTCPARPSRSSASWSASNTGGLRRSSYHHRERALHPPSFLCDRGARTARGPAWPVASVADGPGIPSSGAGVRPAVQLLCSNLLPAGVRTADRPQHTDGAEASVHHALAWRRVTRAGTPSPGVPSLKGSCSAD